MGTIFFIYRPNIAHISNQGHIPKLNFNFNWVENSINFVFFSTTRPPTRNSSETPTSTSILISTRFKNTYLLHLVHLLHLLNIFHIAKLSQAPAPAGLSIALFPNYPATRPDPTRPDPTGIVFFQQYLILYLMQFSHNQAKLSSSQLDWVFAAKLK